MTLLLSRMVLALWVLLCGLAVEAAPNKNPLPRIGWVYRIEGQIEGRSVVYVGSAADLKQRLTRSHRWAELLRQETTRVYAMEVFAELDIHASNRQTLLSARTEALRAAEQRALEQARGRAEWSNRELLPGEKETVLLNEVNASVDAASWETRHKVSTSNSWQLLERRLVGATTRAMIALTVLDVYLLYREAKMGRFVMAPYILGDEHGFFTLEQESPLFKSPSYYKVYWNDGVRGKRLDVSASEFQVLKAEAEALWGTTDWEGEFVPGLLNKALPIIPAEASVRMD